jgi:hypothetical protein
MTKSWLRAAITLTAVAALALAAVGCDQAEPGNGPDGPGGDRTPGETVDRILVDQDAEAQEFELRGGRYRVSWSHRCPTIGVRLTSLADGTAVYEREARSQNFSAIVSNVPAGAYEFTETTGECDRYEIRLDRI